MRVSKIKSRAVECLLLPLLFLSYFNPAFAQKLKPSFCGIEIGSKIDNLSNVDGVKIVKSESLSDSKLNVLSIDKNLLPYPVKKTEAYSSLVTGTIYRIKVVIYNDLAGDNREWAKTRFEAIAKSLKDNYNARFKDDGGKTIAELFPEAIILKNGYKITLKVPNVLGFVIDSNEIHLEYLSLHYLDKAQKEAAKSELSEGNNAENSAKF